MAIENGDFIRLSYTGMVEGEIFDTTDEARAKDEGIFDPSKQYNPITIRVGAGHIIPGLDEALIGKEVGDEADIEITPEKGYGVRDESLVRSTLVKNFKEKPAIGTRIQSEGQEGVVINIIGKRAVIDFNHPFAGKVLKYSYRIEEKVEKTVDKAKALIKLFSGRDMDVELRKNTLTIILPPGIAYDRRWLMGRGMTVHQIFEFIDEIDTVIQKEVFRRPKKSEITEEAAEPVEIAEESSEE